MMNGLYYDDFEEGKTYSTAGRTVTETDLVTFTTLCGFFEPLFMDRQYVETQTPFQKPIAPGALTFSLSEGLTILSGILHKTGMALLGVEIDILKPVFVGDTLSVQIEVTHRRETKKSDRGIVTFLHTVWNQNNVQVMAYRVKRMMKRRSG